MPEIFSVRRDKRERDHEAFQAQLSPHLGQRKVELDWVKKKLAVAPDAKRALIAPAHPQMRLARQGDLVGLPRSTYPSQAQGERAEHLHVMRLLAQH